MSILTLVNITKTYGSGVTEVRALQNINLQVNSGELVAVMGASGSGKSTLLAVAGGLETPSSGEVIIEDKALSSRSADQIAALRRQTVGYVFQEFNLIPSLTALENVALPLELDGVSPQVALAQAETALAEIGLAQVAQRFPDELSGGGRQRVAIARALVGERKLLLADEPTGALDSRTGDEILQILRERITNGSAGILVTHDPRHAAWADRVIYLRDGQIVDQLAPSPAIIVPVATRHSANSGILPASAMENTNTTFTKPVTGDEANSSVVS